MKRGGGAWTTITYDDFESGMGNYTDGGADMSLYTGGTYSYQGNAARYPGQQRHCVVVLPHNRAQRFGLYRPSKSTSISIAISMENGEDFWVQYYNGSAWQTVAPRSRGTISQQHLLPSRP